MHCFFFLEEEAKIYISVILMLQNYHLLDIPCKIAKSFTSGPLKLILKSQLFCVTIKKKDVIPICTYHPPPACLLLQVLNWGGTHAGSFLSWAVCNHSYTMWLGHADITAEIPLLDPERTLPLDSQQQLSI